MDDELVEGREEGLRVVGKDRYGLRGLGAIESNLDKLVASRMKERGQLHLWANGSRQLKVSAGTGARFRLRLENDKPSEDKYWAWLEAGMPALQGLWDVSGHQSTSPLISSGLDDPSFRG